MKHEAKCQICKGQSWTEAIVGDDVVPSRCACFKRRLAMSFLGPELAKAAHRRSELYQVKRDPDTEETIGDRTLDDLFIKGAWREVSQHLRWAIGAKHYDDAEFTFKMVNDEMLLRVYLGDFRYSNRSKKVRDEIETYNGLSDLVDGCSLLIVRLGKLAHNNRAAGNILLEALNLRAAASKPTWLIEGETFFGPGHKFYNDEVGQYIEENFERINVGGDVEAAREATAQLLALSGETVSFDAEENAPALVQTEEKFKEPVNAWEKREKKAPKKWKSGKRKGGLEDFEI